MIKLKNITETLNKDFSVILNKILYKNVQIHILKEFKEIL